ncbi:MAG: hypothetical protein KAJ40_02040 [Alphaproteobacteria bacterium]|nr:hypothetical protein [Alphaproteobacteria bacterium]
MRKFLFILLLVPFFASVGHDIYLYYQNPDKGVRISDVGVLWDKYHKESHDQWKSKVHKFSSEIDKLVAENPISKNMIPKAMKNSASTNDETQPPQIEENIPEINALTEGFTQTSSHDGITTTVPFEPRDEIKEHSNVLIKWIGFLLEQKAIYVTGLILIIAFLLNAILSFLFRKKGEMERFHGIRKKNSKNDGYKYKRK